MNGEVVRPLRFPSESVLLRKEEIKMKDRVKLSLKGFGKRLVQRTKIISW